jgi:GTPase involved in cell partitioning and DNA repair
LVDCCDDNPVESWKVIQNEIKEYGADLDSKKCITVLTKSDALLDELITEIENNLKKAGANEVCSISSISNKGISSILRKISFAIVNVDKNTKQET